MATLLDPASCGPVTLALCQDVQAQAGDFPEAFFEPRIWRSPRLAPDADELTSLVTLLGNASAPLIVAGGGVLYSRAEETLASFAAATGIPVAETQAGKGSLLWNHPCALGSIGVTGTSAANKAAAAADVIIGVGTRLQDFTTASRTLFRNPQRQLIQVNVATFDAYKHSAHPVVGDARAVLEALWATLPAYRVPQQWANQCKAWVDEWNEVWLRVTTAHNDGKLPTDAEVIGAVWRSLPPSTVVVCAAGGLPGELHKLWRTAEPGGYHVEYGYSCMGYEIAGGLGVKLAAPERDVCVMVGDGSYLMMNSEIATSVMLGRKLIVVVLDNRGYACINRLQQATGSAPFNNLLADTNSRVDVGIDFAAHATSLGAHAQKVRSIVELEAALGTARAVDRTCVVVIDTDPLATTQEGGAWWDVAVPEVSARPQVQAARAAYDLMVKSRDCNG
jgi:3D-(3,5/4)-trihydroxycyclohexane-1,2-dione acylhydrolase (decyclizing)